MKIGIVSDHRGYELKEKIKKYLINNNYELEDFGTYSSERVDYPEYAFKLAKGLQEHKVNFGIAICGTGIGMSIALNKAKDIMCAKVTTPEEAFYAKKHNNVSVIALSSKITMFKAKKILNKFLTTNYEQINPYQKRIEYILEHQND